MFYQIYKFITGLTLVVMSNLVTAETLKIYFPYAAGNAYDVVLRKVAANISDANDTMVVVPTPGAGGLVALSTMRNLKDNSVVNIGNALLTADNINVERDLKIVHFMGIEPTMIVVNSASQYYNIKDLHDRAKTSEVFYGSSGVGSYGHYSSSIIANMNKKFVHVPFKTTGQAFPELLAGRLDFLVSDQNLVASHIKSGHLRTIAVNYNRRLDNYPDVTTLREQNINNLNYYRWEMIVTNNDNNSPILSKLQVALRTTEIQNELKSRGVITETINLETFMSEQRRILDNVKKFVQ